MMFPFVILALNWVCSRKKKLEVGEGCQNLTIGWLSEKVKDYEGCGRRRLPEITQDG